MPCVMLIADLLEHPPHMHWAHSASSQKNHFMQVYCLIVLVFLPSDTLVLFSLARRPLRCVRTALDPVCTNEIQAGRYNCTHYYHARWQRSDGQHRGGRGLGVRHTMFQRTLQPHGLPLLHLVGATRT